MKKKQDFTEKPLSFNSVTTKVKEKLATVERKKMHIAWFTKVTGFKKGDLGFLPHHLVSDSLVSSRCSADLVACCLGEALTFSLQQPKTSGNFLSLLHPLPLTPLPYSMPWDVNKENCLPLKVRQGMVPDYYTFYKLSSFLGKISHHST